jgi:hypothetical protein
MTPDPTRRDLLKRAGSGLGGLGLLSALGQGGLFGAPVHAAMPFAGDAMDPRLPHFAAKAKRCLFLFMFGGPSQMDLFDYKPELQKRHGQTVDMERRRRKTQPATLLGSRRTFAQRGETGQWISDALPLMAEHIDKLAVVKSLYTDSFAHGSALLQMNSSFALQGHPSLGSWMTYGLGSRNLDLPGYVVMHDPRGGPISGALNWSAGYMPAAYQGTLFRATGDPLLHMSPVPAAGGRSAMTDAMAQQQLELALALNRGHEAAHPGWSELPARSGAHELAERMGTSAPEALDVDSESEETRRMYGLFDPVSDHPLAIGAAPFGRQCLIARRLLERDVRFVQIYSGGGHQQQTWDAHFGVEENLSIHCPEVDRPIHGLLTDLERTGLLDETLVIWGGEFGRMPTSQQAGDGQEENPDGRDHNPKGFTMWMAGAGIKPGSHGETDELGAAAVRDRHHVRELHATILHLMGLDYRQLTYPYGGLDRRMTGPEDVPLIDAVLA